MVFYVYSAFGLSQDTFRLLPQNRSFLMGFIPIPKQPLGTKSWQDAFLLLGKHSEVVLHHLHVDWGYFLGRTTHAPEIESLEFISAMAKKHNLHLFLVIDPLTPDRSTIDCFETGLSPSFSDENIRKAFRKCVQRVIARYQPAYLALGSEFNTYFAKNQAEKKHFLSLYRILYKGLKERFPALPIFITFQFESLSGMVDGNSQWELIEDFFPYLDIFAISTYPYPWFRNPGLIPENYYHQIKEHINKPLVIAESGWPSNPPGNRDSGDQQEAFLRIFARHIEELSVQVWIWWFLHDWQGEGYPEVFRTMGFFSSQGRKKPAWDFWVQLQNLPLSSIARKPFSDCSLEFQ